MNGRGEKQMEFGPLSELTRNMSPADRAEVERIKADMRREGERLAAAGQVEPGSGPQAVRKGAAQPRPDEQARQHAPEGR